MLALGNVEMAVHGYGSPEHGAAFQEAVVLCRVLHGDCQDAGKLLARAVHGYWIYQLHTGQVMASQPIAAELHDFGRTHNDPEVRRFAATSYAVSCFLTGKLEEGAQVLNLELAEEPTRGQSQSALIGFGVDACSASYAVFSRIRACQGLSEEAAQQATIAVERARHLRHLPTIATCLIQACDVGWILRDPCFFKDWTCELMELSDGLGFEYWRARCKAYLGWIAAAEGQLVEGQTLLTAALAELAGIGVILYGPHIRSMLAEVYVGLDQQHRALELLDEGLDVCSRTGEVWAEPELHRQKGELLRSNPEVAKACSERSIKIARGQSAKLFELRATASLARLFQAG